MASLTVNLRTLAVSTSRLAAATTAHARDLAATRALLAQGVTLDVAVTATDETDTTPRTKTERVLLAIPPGGWDAFDAAVRKEWARQASARRNWKWPIRDPRSTQFVLGPGDPRLLRPRDYVMLAVLLGAGR